MKHLAIILITILALSGITAKAQNKMPALLYHTLATDSTGLVLTNHAVSLKEVKLKGYLPTNGDVSGYGVLGY